MKACVDFLFLCLLFEPERIIFNSLFCPFKFLPSIIHTVSFIFFTAFVFYRASQENKLVYTQKQLRLLVLFLFLSIVYCTYFYFNRISFFNFGLKVKLFLFCSYFIVLKQYLVMTDHRELFKRISFVLFILTIITLPWTLGISKDLINRNIFPYNPNWFACLLCFMFLYFCKQMKQDKSRFLLWVSLLFILFLFQTRSSFFLASFILPFFVFKKRIYIISCIIAISCFFCGLYYSNVKNNKIVNNLQGKNYFNVFKQQYIIGTSCGNFLSEKFNISQLKTHKGRELKESHNFYVTFFRDFNFVEQCIFLTIFLLSFSSSSILFLLYCFTITAPLYFFIVFTLLATKIKRS